MDERAFVSLTDYLHRIPAINGTISTGVHNNDVWWVKFAIDIEHMFAWHVVQELGHVLNYLSVSKRLPTRFFPVSPPPYLNGGPDRYLLWVIECNNPDFQPGTIAEWLEGRLPKPVDDLEQWEMNDDY